MENLRCIAKLRTAFVSTIAVHRDKPHNNVNLLDDEQQ